MYSDNVYNKIWQENTLNTSFLYKLSFSGILKENDAYAVVGSSTVLITSPCRPPGFSV